MKELYQKPEIVSVALKAGEFFAAQAEYDPDEVAKALEAAGVIDDTKKLGLDNWDLWS